MGGWCCMSATVVDGDCVHDSVLPLVMKSAILVHEHCNFVDELEILFECLSSAWSVKLDAGIIPVCVFGDRITWADNFWIVCRFHSFINVGSGRHSEGRVTLAESCFNFPSFSPLILKITFQMTLCHISKCIFASKVVYSNLHLLNHTFASTFNVVSQLISMRRKCVGLMMLTNAKYRN